MRSEALRGIDGFDHLKLSVDDDNRLAQALKVAGYRGRAVLGVGAVSVRWQVGLGGLIRGMEKNHFAFFDYRLGLVAVVCLFWLAFGFAPFAGLFLGPWWARATCPSGSRPSPALLAATRRQTGIAWYYALAFPLTIALVLAAMIRSAWLTLRRGASAGGAASIPWASCGSTSGLRNAWLRHARRPAG